MVKLLLQGYPSISPNKPTRFSSFHCKFWYWSGWTWCIQCFSICHHARFAFCCCFENISMHLVPELLYYMYTRGLWYCFFFFFYHYCYFLQKTPGIPTSLKQKLIDLWERHSRDEDLDGTCWFGNCMFTLQQSAWEIECCLHREDAGQWQRQCCPRDGKTLQQWMLPQGMVWVLRGLYWGSSNEVCCILCEEQSVVLMLMFKSVMTFAVMMKILMMHLTSY